MDPLKRWIGKHGIMWAIGALVLLAAILLLPFSLGEGRATLIGSALGAVIAVGLAAAVADSERHREVETLVLYCADSARDIGRSLESIVEVFDRIGDESRIPASEKDQLIVARETFVEAMSRSTMRMKRVHASFLRMPSSAIDAVSEMEQVRGRLSPHLVNNLAEGWTFQYLSETDYPPRPKVAKLAREARADLLRIATFLDSVASGQLH